MKLVIKSINFIIFVIKQGNLNKWNKIEKWGKYER